MGKFSYNQEALKNLNIEDTALLDHLVDFESARETHLKKPRGKVDKRISLKEAVAEYVSDGDVLCQDVSSGLFRDNETGEKGSADDRRPKYEPELHDKLRFG